MQNQSFIVALIAVVMAVVGSASLDAARIAASTAPPDSSTGTIHEFSPDELRRDDSAYLPPASPEPPDSVAAIPLDTTAVQDSSRLAKMGRDLLVIGDDALSFFSAPVRLKPLGWVITGGALAATFGLMGTDSATIEEIRRLNKPSTLTTIMDAGSRYGEIAYANILTGAMYATGVAIDNDWMRVTGRMLAQSILYSGTITMALRYLVGRSRPANTGDAWEYNFFQTTNEYQSFPSGHTTVAFAVSTVLARRTRHPVAQVAFYSAATLCMVSRIYFFRHWSSDVFIGAVLGLASGHFVANRERDRELEALKDDLLGNHYTPQWQFYATGNGVGVMYRF